MPPHGQHSQKYPLTCGFGARGGIRTLDLPITSRFPTVHDLASSAVLAGQVRCVVRLIRVVSYGVGRGAMTGRMTAALPNHQIGSLSVAIGLEGGQPPRPAPDATNRLRRRVQRVGPAGDHPSPGGWWLRWTMTVPGRSASPATRSQVAAVHPLRVMPAHPRRSRLASRGPSGWPWVDAAGRRRLDGVAVGDGQAGRADGRGQLPCSGTGSRATTRGTWCVDNRRTKGPLSLMLPTWCWWRRLGRPAVRDKG
jgi:hypothetical protein